MKLAFITALAVAGAFATAAPALAFVTPEQAQNAADEAVAWYATQQDASGSIGFFGGDWSMIALANAGKSAADLRLSPTDPSLQDFFADDWQFPFGGPGESSTDQSRGLLTGRAGGIQTARLSEDKNLVAKQVTHFDGKQLGNKAQVNDDIFGLLALEREGAADAIAPALVAEVKSKQDGGGWNFGGGGDPDPDVTGSGIAALCAGGVAVTDPAVEAALDYLETKQDPATGGFESDFFGVNSDTTGWVVNGLRQCGIDPQSARWTTAGGKTPLDFLLSQQKANGSFKWQPAETDADPDNLFATQDALTGLVGEGFGTEPAARESGTDPLFRPAPAVAAGTTVPLTLVLDHGQAVAGAERACLLEAPLGATVAEALETGSTTPAYCAAGIQIAGDRLTAVNGVTAADGAAWKVSVDGGAEREALDTPVALGSTVALRLAAAPAQPAKPLPPLAPLPPPPAAPTVVRNVVVSSARVRLGSNGRVRVAVRCPAGLGSQGCRGVLRVKYSRGVSASAAFAVASGQRKVVSLRLSRRLRALVRASRSGRVVSLEAAVRDADTGATFVTRTRARVLKPRG